MGKMIIKQSTKFFKIFIIVSVLLGICISLLAAFDIIPIFISAVPYTVAVALLIFAIVTFYIFRISFIKPTTKENLDCYHIHAYGVFIIHSAITTVISAIALVLAGTVPVLNAIFVFFLTSAFIFLILCFIAMLTSIINSLECYRHYEM